MQASTFHQLEHSQLPQDHNLGANANMASFVARLMSLSPQEVQCLHSDSQLMRQLTETQLLVESRLNSLNKLGLNNNSNSNTYQNQAHFVPTQQAMQTNTSYNLNSANPFETIQNMNPLELQICGQQANQLLASTTNYWPHQAYAAHHQAQLISLPVALVQAQQNLDLINIHHDTSNNQLVLDLRTQASEVDGDRSGSSSVETLDGPAALVNQLKQSKQASRVVHPKKAKLSEYQRLTTDDSHMSNGSKKRPKFENIHAFSEDNENDIDERSAQNHHRPRRKAAQGKGKQQGQQLLLVDELMKQGKQCSNMTTTTTITTTTTTTRNDTPNENGDDQEVESEPSGPVQGTRKYKGEFDEPSCEQVEARQRSLTEANENYHQLNWLSGQCACVLGSKFSGSKTAGDILRQVEMWRQLNTYERLKFKWSLEDLPKDIPLADIKRYEDLRREASNGRANFGGASKRKPLGIRGTRQFLLILYCLWGHPGRQDPMQRDGYCPHCFAKIRKANEQSTLVRVVNHFNMKHRQGANPRLSPKRDLTVSTNQHNRQEVSIGAEVTMKSSPRGEDLTTPSD